MGMKELSKKMYDEVPHGGSLFTIDKIGLRIDTAHLNKEKAKWWFKGNLVNILIYGNTTQISIHAEFEPWEKHLGKRCLDAILKLTFSGVFNLSFMTLFYPMLRSFIPYIILNNSYSFILLSNFFTISEWEWAFDFLDFYPFLSINTDKNNSKSLFKHKDGNTLYSRDYKETRRTKNENGQEYSELKGVQKSFLSNYNKGKLIKSERPIYRTEIRQQGKHKKDLTIELLDGTAEDAFSRMLPKLKKNISKVIEPDTMVLSDYWESNTPEQYKQLFLG
jgi:hypothetical protein